MEPSIDARRARAKSDFKRMIMWLGVVAVLMVIAAITYLSLTGPLEIHMVFATIGGVFVSVMLGGALMAATFFSDKSGHDDEVMHQPEKDEDQP